MTVRRRLIEQLTGLRAKNDQMAQLVKEVGREVDRLPPPRLKPGTLVQLNPDTVTNPMLSGCFMVVTETRNFGVIGYIQTPGAFGQPGGLVYYRATWDEFQIVGMAAWVTDLRID